MKKFLFLLILISHNLLANALPNTLEKIRPSIVAIGAFDPLSIPNTTILGTGFAIGDGSLIATNAHIINHSIFKDRNYKLNIYVGHGNQVKIREAKVLAADELYDLAIIKMNGPPLAPLSFSTQKIREGESFAFTGFPIANVIGLYPVTNQGIVSSISPIATPARSTKELSAKKIRLLKRPYNIYLLDAIAYPGNSGSPVYDPNTGKVIAVINKGFVKSIKESALENPSAITYAIGIKHLQRLLLRQSKG